MTTSLSFFFFLLHIYILCILKNITFDSSMFLSAEKIMKSLVTNLNNLLKDFEILS